MRAIGRVGFTPFIFLSVLIHAFGALAFAAYLAMPSSQPEESLLARGPVRVRLGKLVPSLSASQVKPLPQSTAPPRPTPLAPSVTAIPQKRETLQSLEPTAFSQELPPQVTPVPKNPDLLNPLRSAEIQVPEIAPETLPRLHTTAKPSQTLVQGRLTLLERSAKTTVEHLSDQGKAALKPTNGPKAEKGAPSPVPRIDRIPSAIAQPPVQALKNRGQVAKVDLPKAIRSTHPPKNILPTTKSKKTKIEGTLLSKVEPTPRKMTLTKTVKPARLQKSVYSPKAPATVPKKARQETLERTSKKLFVPANVSDLIRLRLEEKKIEKHPRTATELLSSLDIRMKKQVRPAKGEKPRARKKARLAPLMTQDVRYRGYRYTIWKRIDDRLFYPDAAADEKVRGKVIVRFEVTRDGQLATLKLVQSSGFALFDEEALMAVRRAAPFPKFPPTISGNRLAIKSEILYEP
jgi:TonB family protein